MLKATLFLTLLSLQGVIANSGEEGLVVMSHADSSRRAALQGYDFGRAQKRQEDNDDDDDDGAEKKFTFPEMQSTGDLSIENMNDIEAIDLSRLETVDGNLTIAGNSDLETLTLPALRRVGGNLVLAGSFTTIDLPALAEVGGVFSVTSSRDGFNCSAFENDLADVDVGGEFLCLGPGDDDEDDDDDDDDDDANKDNNEDDNDGDDTSGAAGPPRFGWLTLLVVPALLML